jgi:arabinofuranosyltransferase
VDGAPKHVDLFDERTGETRMATEVAVYALAAVLAVVALYKARHFYEDDAYITLRYVHRWRDGSGPTWTDGERVQGYTHPLWFLQLALLGRLGADLALASRALGVLYFGAIFVVFQRARAMPFSVLVLATLPGLSVWAMGGLETVSFAFWLVLAASLTARIAQTENASMRSGALAGAALAAAALTRPEGLGVAVVAGAWVLATGRQRALRGLAAAFVAPIAAWESFSALYYGDLVANPVYAKITGYPLRQSALDGFTYLAVTAPSWGWAVLASLLALALARRARVGGSTKHTGTSALWILAMALPVVLGLVIGGGDHMVGARLFVPVVVVVVFAAGLYGRTKPAWLVPLLLASAAALQAPVALSGERRPDRAAVIGGIVGRFLEDKLPRGSLAAISVAGSTAFFAPSLRFIDTLGLNDRHIAHRAVPVGVTVWQAMAGHRKGDGEYVLSRSPDVVILGAASGFLGLDEREWFLTDYELLQSDQFRLQYRPYSFRLQEGDSQGLPNLHLLAYLRKGSTAADGLAAIGIRLRGPWYTAESHSVAATSSGVGFQPE